MGHTTARENIVLGAFNISSDLVQNWQAVINQPVNETIQQVTRTLIEMPLPCFLMNLTASEQLYQKLKFAFM